MDGVLSRSADPTRIPRILMAENHFSTVESLIQTIGDRRLHLDFDVCTSHHSAVHKLLAFPYQLIISGVQLAELDDFSLLKRTQALEAFVPLVITATTGDKESARRVLEQGAFDLITTPLEPQQAVDTIRLALWHHKLKALIASRDKALERYRQHMDNYPGNRMDDAFRTILTSIELSISAHDRTIELIETSAKCLADLAKSVEERAREQALRRVDTLLR
jgi:DNA-binding NtrC family response regulator